MRECLKDELLERQKLIEAILQSLMEIQYTHREKSGIYALMAALTARQTSQIKTIVVTKEDNDGFPF